MVLCKLSGVSSTLGVMVVQESLILEGGGFGWVVSPCCAAIHLVPSGVCLMGEHCGRDVDVCDGYAANQRPPFRLHVRHCLASPNSCGLG